MARRVAPMLAVGSTGASGRPKFDLHELLATGDWALDTKLDGERAMWDDGRLISRTGDDITFKFPEVVARLALQSDMTLDGEIVALDGNFETVLMRASQTVPAKVAPVVESHPCRFVAFDLPRLGATIGGPVEWVKRRRRLERLAELRGLSITPVSYDDSLWHATGEQGMEGVIAKRLNGRYRPGKRSTDWIKFKHLHRVSCVVAGYLPGEGSREHFGAIVLAMLDKNEPVSVGRCGSGFTVRQTHELKARLDAGEILIAEIETTGLTSGRTLRFPVFRGVRTDVGVIDCTVDQLDALPQS